MKVLILAGGLGSRLSEETGLKPKPMVEIGGKPILWHIMKIYLTYGYNEFVILCGYKGYVIKEYFANYYRHMADITIDMVNNTTEFHSNNAEPWKVTMIDTGEETMTGGRIKRVKKIIGNEPFMLTYGDGVADIDINKLVKFHKQHGKAMTMSAVQADGRFGSLKIDKDNSVNSFKEKPKGDRALINGGFFVLSPKVLKKITGDDCVWEQNPLIELAQEKELMAYEHQGFWQPMDTLNDKNTLEALWQTGKAPWKSWT